MTNLENEKLEETAKITKLTNILNIFNNTHETIVLLRDIPLNEEFNTVFQIVEELSNQKIIFDDRIDIFFDKFQIKRALLELLPNYELAKNDFEEYSWIKVTGTLKKGLYNNSNIPILEIQTIMLSEKPENATVPMPDSDYVPTAVIY